MLCSNGARKNGCPRANPHLGPHPDLIRGQPSSLPGRFQNPLSSLSHIRAHGGPAPVRGHRLRSPTSPPPRPCFIKKPPTLLRPLLFFLIIVIRVTRRFVGNGIKHLFPRVRKSPAASAPALQCTPHRSPRGRKGLRDPTDPSEQGQGPAGGPVVPEGLSPRPEQEASGTFSVIISIF